MTASQWLVFPLHQAALEDMATSRYSELFSELPFLCPSSLATEAPEGHSDLGHWIGGLHYD